MKSIRHWWNKIVAYGPLLGYHLNASKSWLVVKPDMEESAIAIFNDTDIRITTEGRKYLGGYVGTASGKEQYVSSLVDSWCDQLRVL